MSKLYLVFLLVIAISAVNCQNSHNACGFPNRYVHLGGNWRESSGKIWTCVQQGTHFTWTQQETGRKATGFLLSQCFSPSLAAYMTFDGNTHWKVSISDSADTIIGPTDTFAKVNPMQAPLIPRVSYKERSGKIWQVISSSCNSFSLRNQQDGRTADGSYSFDPINGNTVMYITFNNPEGKDLLRAIAPNMDIWQLSNGEVFRRV